MTLGTDNDKVSIALLDGNESRIDTISEISRLIFPLLFLLSISDHFPIGIDRLSLYENWLPHFLICFSGYISSVIKLL